MFKKIKNIKDNFDSAMKDKSNSYINPVSLSNPKELKNIMSRMLKIKKRLKIIKKEIEKENNQEKIKDFKELSNIIKKGKYSQLENTLINFNKKYPDFEKRYRELCL